MALIPAFSDDKNTTISKLSAQIKKIFDAILKNPIVDYQIIKEQTILTSTTKVFHNLGRVPKGYIITKQNASAIIYYTEITDKFIILDSSATVKIDLYIY